MQGNKSGLMLFALGAFFVHIHTTVPFLWALVGIPLAYPLMVTKGVLAVLPAFTPPIGAVLLVVGSLIYGPEVRR